MCVGDFATAGLRTRHLREVTVNAPVMVSRTKLTIRDCVSDQVNNSDDLLRAADARTRDGTLLYLRAAQAP